MPCLCTTQPLKSGHLTNQDTFFCPKGVRIREVPTVNVKQAKWLPFVLIYIGYMTVHTDTIKNTLLCRNDPQGHELQASSPWDSIFNTYLPPKFNFRTTSDAFRQIFHEILPPSRRRYFVQHPPAPWTG